MKRCDILLLVVLLAAVIAGTVGGCLLLITHLEPLAHLLLLFFLIASG